MVKLTQKSKMKILSMVFSTDSLKTTLKMNTDLTNDEVKFIVEAVKQKLNRTKLE
jgi:hypothetical protein